MVAAGAALTARRRLCQQGTDYADTTGREADCSLHTAPKRPSPTQTRRQDVEVNLHWRLSHLASPFLPPEVATVARRLAGPVRDDCDVSEVQSAAVQQLQRPACFFADQNALRPPDGRAHFGSGGAGLPEPTGFDARTALPHTPRTAPITHHESDQLVTCRCSKFRGSVYVRQFASYLARLEGYARLRG